MKVILRTAEEVPLEDNSLQTLEEHGMGCFAGISLDWCFSYRGDAMLEGQDQDKDKKILIIGSAQRVLKEKTKGKPILVTQQTN